MKKILLAMVAGLFIVGCQPKVGSDEWCAKMKEKPKADWSANEAADYAEHCVLDQKPDDDEG
ncbi:DUF3012 domain-containing protein [Thalassotalea sp. PS06]|uniref:DUF3012 domain-containing protein n=1 Tax=Thalassotalea sp. PS06 TaxID=2594005 RepID=UPI00116415CC|nr:DUF3012 domain-containing protein [Thalassotalea sp. PS06]QDP01172.1 DUF3012 domain-containing protein [Thalassotalea sp. PS06]